MKKKSFIGVSVDYEGFHCYLNAPEEVAFLRNNHRHLFKIEVLVEVFHNERELEFFIEKKLIQNILNQNNFNCLSCENMADKLYNKLSTKYKDREVRISVSEDGENRAYVEYK